MPIEIRYQRVARDIDSTLAKADDNRGPHAGGQSRSHSQQHQTDRVEAHREDQQEVRTATMADFPRGR